jgi:hypothetical protein
MKRDSVKMDKLLVGANVDVADIVNAHAEIVRQYPVIVFDLAFGLEGGALDRMVELRAGFTSDGNYTVPTLWNTIMAEPRALLFILPQRESRKGRHAIDATFKALRILAGISAPRIETNYDLLPIAFLPFGDDGGGRPLRSRYHTLTELKPKKVACDFGRWLDAGMAFSYFDEETLPQAMDFKPLASLRPGARDLVIAGALRVGRSLVVFLPTTSLEPIDWIKTIAEIGKFFSGHLAEPEKLFGLSSDEVVLGRIVLQARESAEVLNEKPGTAVVSLIVDGKEIEMCAPARKGKGRGRFNLKHLSLLREIQDKSLSLEVAARIVDCTKTRLSSLLSDFRSATEIALVAAGLCGDLASKIFPLGRAEIGLPDRNIHVF